MSFTSNVLSVTGGFYITNGYRPLYSNVTATSVTTGAYGTHYNITNSGFGAITLGSSTGATADYNAYWVFRNNTGAYLNITVTYTVSGGGTGTVTIPPATSLTIMFTATSGGSTGVVFF